MNWLPWNKPSARWAMEQYVYHYAPRPRWYHTLTGQIVFLNILVFILQIWRDDAGHEFTYAFALSLQGLKEGHWWQLLSFQLLHGGLLHLVLNCLIIHVMGRALEDLIGKKRLFIVYVLGGVTGGLLEMLLEWLWPNEVTRVVLGASAGAAGLVAAFATLFPFQRLRVLIFFIIPVAMTARTLLWITIIISLVGLAGFLGEGIAHAGHLGGILWGIFYTKARLRHLVAPPPLPQNPCC